MTFAHPFRFTSTGRTATLIPGSPEHASQLAGHVLSVTPGERALAPAFGLPDQVGGGVDPSQVHAALATCAPELGVDSITVTAAPDGHVDVTVTVEWDQGED